MTRMDRVLILFLIGLSCILFIWRQIAIFPSGGVVEAKLDGKVILRVDLATVSQEKYVLELPGGKAGLEVKDKAVRLFRIDKFCPNEVCIRTGWIRNGGEKIICVPNKLVVEIKNKRVRIDAVTK